MKLEIFLCYAREDEEQVKNLYQRLTEAGFKPWMDKMDLLGGESWETRIERAIRRADLFLACLSSNSIKKRGFVQTELTKALSILKEKLDEDIYIIPVRLDECEVPENLRSLTWVDYFHDTGWPSLKRSLEFAVARLGSQMSSVDNCSSKPLNSVAPVRAYETERPQNPTMLAHDSDFDHMHVQTANKINEAARGSLSAHALRWDVELQKILNGEREDLIERFGDVTEYVETILSDSDDITGSQLGFQEALRKLLREQSPYKRLSEGYIVQLLALVTAYLPSEGELWVLNFIKHKRRWAGNKSSTEIEKHSNDIHMSALIALESYFPVAPVGRSPAFEEYVNVLRWITETPHCGYAVLRLIELEVFQPGDDEVLQLIERAPQCLQEIVSLVLSASRRSRLCRDFSMIYSHCLLSSNNIQQVLEEELKAIGAGIQHSNQGPMLVIDETIIVALDLPEPALHEYLMERFNTATKFGIEKLMWTMGIN